MLLFRPFYLCKMKVVIVHGSNSTEKAAYECGRENIRHWHVWLRAKLKEKGIAVSGELYPHDWEPNYVRA